MEVLGGVASIVTLIEATGVLAEVSTNLVVRWRNAPHEIQALGTRLSLLAAELQSIKNATARSHPVLTDAIIRQSLSDVLTDVRKHLTKLESLNLHLQQHGPVRQRIQWTVKDAGSVEKTLNKTLEVEQRLANLMTLISLRAQTPILEGLERIEKMVSTLVVSLPASAPVAPITPSPIAVANGTVPNAVTGTGVKRTLMSSTQAMGKNWESWGFRGLFVTAKKDLYHEYNINFSISLPLAPILGGYALTGCLNLQLNSFCGNALTLRHPSYFAVSRVVDSCHPFLLACRNDDVETVRSMLRSGQGRPTDVTRTGQTPMSFAVESGAITALAELLDCGANVDAVTDYSTMSTALIQSSELKDLDTVRFLLQRGASADPVNSEGHGASASCWAKSDHLTKHLSVEVFNLLVESAELDLDTSVTLLFAGADVCCSQVDSLVRLGCQSGQDGFTGLAPIQIAAFHGNYSTYSGLALYYEPDVFKNDIPFASLLLQRVLLGKSHPMIDLWKSRAVSPKKPREYDDILMDILRRGVDTQGKQPVPYYDWIPPKARGLDMTADELVKALGPDIEAWYLSMLRSCGLLNVRGDARRLRELAEAGHVGAGFVYEREEEVDEVDFKPQVDCEENNEIADYAEGHGKAGIYADTDNGPAYGASSDAKDDDQFWDAEEVV